MNKIILLCLCALSSAVFAMEGWETDAKKALNLAKEEGKDLIVVFKNKDWNPDAYGHAEALFKTDDFNKVTKAGFVKLLLPYESNEALQWKVKPGKASEKSLPALYFLSQSGLPVDSMSASLRSGPEWFVFKVKGFPEKKKKVMDAWARLKELSGKEKYLLAKDFFEEDGEYIPYIELKESIKREDKEDVAGFRKAALSSKAEQEAEELLEQVKTFAEQTVSRTDLTLDQKIKIASRYFSQMLELREKDTVMFVRYLTLIGGSGVKSPERMAAETPGEELRVWEEEANAFIADYAGTEMAKGLSFWKKDLIILSGFTTKSMDEKNRKNIDIEALKKEVESIKVSTLNSRQVLLGSAALALLQSGSTDEFISYAKKARDMAPWTEYSGKVNNNITYVEKNGEFIGRISAKLRNKEELSFDERQKLNENLYLIIDYSFSVR